MPQMAIIQPTAPQAPLAGSPGNKEQGQFSPHLENALSSNKKQQQTRHDNSDTSAASDENILTDENSQSMEAQGLEANHESIVLANTAAPADALKATPEQTLLATRGTEPYKATKAPGSDAIFSEVPATDTTTEAEVLNPTRPLASSDQDALMSQLQHIIDNANETGIVSITKVGNNSTAHLPTNNLHGLTTAASSGNTESNAVATTTAPSEFTLNGLLGQNGADIEKAAGKAAQQLDGIRNDSQQQYYNAKINPQNPADNNQNFQGNQTGDEVSQQTASSNPQNGPFSAAESTNTFSQISTLAQETPSLPASELAKPIMLPSGTIVYEEEIIQQLSQRFQISGKKMDSRINLKLNPAELGELKINLSLKEGSIKANVVAQSQHTLEILEKNIPKLKTMLESQGFTVDEITVATESESVGEFDLFDRQLFSHNDYTPAQKGRREDEAISTQDDSKSAAPATSTGVNVTI